MSSCLGLYIENNIIKYAKVSKEHENYKIEAYGMKFYDDLDETVKQIVNETFSYKIPVSINLSDEHYTYADLFSLLKQQDLKRAVQTEFEIFCNENKKNYNALEYRNLLIPKPDDKDKVTSLYAYTEKSEITSKLQTLSSYRINNVSPLPVSIVNLLSVNKKNKVIVNIEKNTSVTFIIDGKVHKIETIKTGMEDVFSNIIAKENSYAKAYEICKNTTIYTMQGRDLQIEENEYMQDIMPVLYTIIENIKEIIIASQISVDEIYLTGLATAINNIDLYFQENFMDKKCEILAPFFIEKSNIKLNIKDYIEVNSAIALALQGLGLGHKEMNFRNKGTLNQLLNKEGAGISKSNKDKKVNAGVKLDKFKGLFKLDFNKSLDAVEKYMIRFASGVLILLVVYIILSSILISQINKKEKDIQAFIKESKGKIAEITNNTMLVTERTEQYNTMIQKINEANNKLTESYAKKNAVPNFLTEIMFNIPKEVQLISIQNTTGKTIKIEAQSKEYEQLGYFIAKIKNEGILTNVTATSGQKQQEFVVVTIQGDLPY